MDAVITYWDHTGPEEAAVLNDLLERFENGRVYEPP